MPVDFTELDNLISRSHALNAEQQRIDKEAARIDAEITALIARWRSGTPEEREAATNLARAVDEAAIGIGRDLALGRAVAV